MSMGDKYGMHRVIEPAGAMPQSALRLNNDMSKLYDNELLVDVSTLKIDSASFAQITREARGDAEKIKSIIMSVVGTRGKQQTLMTGSGGMLIGKIEAIGSALRSRDLAVGDKIASLVSLSLTPLRIDRVLAVHKETMRVDVEAKAILFESGVYVKLPEDMDERLALEGDTQGARFRA